MKLSTVLSTRVLLLSQQRAGVLAANIVARKRARESVRDR
jgi:hypothetical protein